MWFTFFIFSALINIILFFYVRWLLNTVAAINEDVSQVSNIIQNFLLHLQSVYELETFYGDQTLKNLLIHSQDLIEQLEDIDLVLNTEKGGEIAEEAQKED